MSFKIETTDPHTGRTKIRRKFSMPRPEFPDGFPHWIALVLLAYIILTPTIRNDMSFFELALALLFFSLVALRLHADRRRFAIASVEYSGAEAEYCIKFWKENLDRHDAALILESYEKLREVCEVKMSILEKQWWRVSVPITAEEHYERLMLREEEKSKRGRFNKLEIGCRVEYGAKDPRKHLSGVIVSMDRKLGQMHVKFRRYSDTGKEPDNSGEEDILKEPWLIWWHEIDDYTFMKDK